MTSPWTIGSVLSAIYVASVTLTTLDAAPLKRKVTLKHPKFGPQSTSSQARAQTLSRRKRGAALAYFCVPTLNRASLDGNALAGKKLQNPFCRIDSAKVSQLTDS